MFRAGGDGNWERFQELRGPEESGFGDDVAAGKGFVLVTAPLEGQSGVVHVLEWSGELYESVAAITTNDAIHFIGSGLSFDGERAVATTGSFEPIPAKVYVLGKENGVWRATHLLETSEDVATSSPVAISADRVVLSGRPSNGDEVLYVYEWSADAWTNVARIPAPVEQGALCFGCTLALSGRMLLVGSASDSEFAQYAGAIYVYLGSGPDWGQVLKITASDNQQWGALGNLSLSTDGHHVAAGSGKQPETVYVFTLPTDLSRKPNIGFAGGLPIEVFPNPFSTSTEIGFSMPNPGPVRLSIYDTIGRIRETVDFGYLPAGSYRHRWTPRQAGSGVYILVVTAGSLYTRRNVVFVHK